MLNPIELYLLSLEINKSTTQSIATHLYELIQTIKNISFTYRTC